MVPPHFSIDIPNAVYITIYIISQNADFVDKISKTCFDFFKKSEGKLCAKTANFTHTRTVGNFMVYFLHNPNPQKGEPKAA